MARDQQKCGCTERWKPRHERAWAVTERLCFNTRAGNHFISRYSRLVCLKCRRSWRSDYKWVHKLPSVDPLLPFFTENPEAVNDE